MRQFRVLSKGLAKRQRGVAALFYVLLVPPLFGLYSLGTDGAIMIQEKARMNDALEAASLAVTAQNDSNQKPDGWDENVEFMGSDSSLALARTYIEQYMHTATDVDYLKVEKLECEDIAACRAGLVEGEQRYYQYHVTATTTHNSLYPHITSELSAEYNVGSTGVGEKYQGLPIDVVIVADYSGSMDEYWNGEKKYESVVGVIEDVTDQLEKANDNSDAQESKIAITSFNSFVNTASSSDSDCFMEMLYLDYVVNEDGEVTDRSVNYSETVKKSNLLRGDRTNNRSHIPSYDKVDGTECLNVELLSGDDSYYAGFEDATFYDIKLTKNFSSFNTKVKTFRPHWATASHQGLIRAGQIAQRGNNPRKFIIVLSDGQDNYWHPYLGSSEGDFTSISNTLYGPLYNMCDNIEAYLNEKSVDVDLGGVENITMQVESEIYVIGFDYDLENNDGLNACAGKDNVYLASNKDEILSKILQLISEEIGHLR
ncbi:TadE/TadG family type IV pilus assembly protein [Vibrio ulleungensis]|uniref:Pilus assembly protein n=1 Tax=Vibrio ulleungensis TaxID=2807619 RepID=A0ABS2HNW6_9VIBR|nr:TadE/TadG family type IV pilus assembly protein [Vibrio ulleungensis]MBM7038391.1 pilus assembly protein [Vibrio ulleungensis]